MGVLHDGLAFGVWKMGVRGVRGGYLGEGWEMVPGNKIGSGTTQNGSRAAVLGSGSGFKNAINSVKNGVLFWV